MANILKGHRITWWVYAGDERIRSQKSMRGAWGYDATCECGWDSKTGGGTAVSVGRAVNDHKADAATPVDTMQITITAPNGDPEVHKFGCSHLNRAAKMSDVTYNTEASTRQEAANGFWADFLDSGEMSEADALMFTSFAPCVKELKS